MKNENIKINDNFNKIKNEKINYNNNNKIFYFIYIIKLIIKLFNNK